MSPEEALLGDGSPGSAGLRLMPPPPLRVVDVAMFYGERSGGIRSYLDAKAAWAARTGAIEHHVIVPGAREAHGATRHELRGVRLVATNGYRIPLGTRRLRRTLEYLEPDVVLLHDPFWAPVGVTAAAHAVGARVVAVHHGSVALDAASLPLPRVVTTPLLRAWLRRAAGPADAVMSCVQTWEDLRRHPDLPIGLGLDEAFRPRPEVARGPSVLYVGRLSREKGIFTLLEAAALSPERWSLRIVGAGPIEDAVLACAERLGIGDRVTVAPFVRSRERLARLYAGASCVVMPGAHETFGLVALEAAASGAPVVSSVTAPATDQIGSLGHPFVPGDVEGLAAAIDRARAAPRDLFAAADVAVRFGWDRVLGAELDALAELVR